MKVYIWPRFREESGQGGIKRVYEALLRYLPEYGVEVVSRIEEADVVNVHADDLLTDKPVAYSNHGLYWAEYSWQNWAYEANAKIVRAMHRANTRAVSVPSRFVHNVLARGMLLNPFVLYHGVSLDEWPIGENEGYVGWFKTRPDPVCDPTPVSVLANRFPKIQFVTTFGTPAQNVQVLGKLPYHESKRWISNAAVYLATVRETGGITLLESMAAGVPPLGFAWGVNPEIIVHKENGYLVPPGDYEGLAEGLQYVLKHRARLSEAARRTVEERFQWKDRIGDYVAFYTAALSECQGPTVSVIITAYNLEEYLPRAIESVLAQTFTDWELIVVDDCSPDRCGEIAEEYAARDPRIVVIHNQRNAYLAEARNIGIRASRGKYILPLDADDELDNQALEILVHALKTNNEIDIVTGAMQVVEEDGTSFVSGWPPNRPSYHLQIQKRNMVPYASMYRRWVWERTGGYRRRMRSAEDAEFWTRAMSFGAVPAKVTERPTLIYRNRRNSMSHVEKEPPWTDWFTWSRKIELTPFAASAIPDGKKCWPVPSYDPPEVSVVIPVGPGHEIYLQDALDSLVAQTFLNWEVVVVNDTGERWFDEKGSPLNPYVVGFPFARFIDSESSKPHGVAWARNRGIQEARAPLFVLLDADDFAQPELLSLLVAAYKEVGGWIYVDFYDQEGTYKESRDWDVDKFLRKMLGPVTGIYAKKDWKAVGGFDVHAPGWEDYDFQMSLFEHGICGSRLAYGGITYRYNTGKRREDNFTKRHDLVQYIRKKHRRLYDDKRFLMACRSCGGGGGRPRISTNRISDQTLDTGEQNMALVEYIGPQTQFQRIRSKASPQHFYRFGGSPGSETRKFFVFEEDLPHFLALRDFRVLQSETLSSETVGDITRQDSVVLSADASRVPNSKKNPVLVVDLDLAPELIAVLVDNGYTTVETLRSASDAELLTVKGIGPRRLKSIRDAISAAT